MSKTIRKIPWAVPGLATLAIVGVLIAFGVMGTNTAHALGADECGFTTDGTDISKAPAATDCLVITDSVEIMVENTSNAEQDVVVLASGGSAFPKVVVADGKTGVDQHSFELDALAVKFGTTTPGLGSFMVTREMAQGGVVVLTAYDTFTGFPLDADSAALPAGADTNGTLNVVFLGAPALKDADGADLSTLTGSLTDGVIPSTAGVATTTATIKDGNGQLLVDGVDDVDSYVTFTVTYAAGSDLKPRSQLVSSADVNVNASGVALLEIGDWNTGADPVKVTVSAIYTGPTGTLDLGEVVYQRADATPTALEAGTFSCIADAGNDEADDGCADDLEPVADTVFGREDVFVIVGEFTDALGSTVAISSPTIVASDTVALRVSATAADSGMATVTVAAEAEYGEYTISVSTGTGDDLVEQVLTVTIGGPPVGYSFVEPVANISLGAGSSAEFTISAVDVNGNVPDFGDDNMVEVIVRGAGPNDVFGLENNLLELDVDTGEGTFEIFTPINAVDGQMAQIIVRTTDGVQATHAITFGEAVAPMPMLTAPTGVTAMAEAGTVTVTWTDGADALGHLVLLFNAADFSSAPMVNAVPTGSSSAQFTDVAAGNYIAVVVSYRSASETAYAVGTVTVNANGVDGVGTAAAN